MAITKTSQLINIQGLTHIENMASEVVGFDFLPNQPITPAAYQAIEDLREALENRQRSYKKCDSCSNEAGYSITGVLGGKASTRFLL